MSRDPIAAIIDGHSASRAPKVLRASAVDPEPVEWFFPPFIPRGKLTTVAGGMGQGKSLLTKLLARHGARTGSVLMRSAEDDPADTIRPRLEAAGADLERVYIDTNPELDPDELAALCEQIGDVELITIDPIQAFLPANVNSWKGQDVRLALEPYRQLAATYGLAVVLIQHLNRRSDASDPLARIADSQGIPQLARSVLLWGPDPADPEGDRGSRKVLTRVKGNLTRETASATFTIREREITGGIRAPYLERGEDREIGADELLADPESRSATEEAAEWLRSLLADGPLPAKEVRKRARDDGIADRTLDRSKAKAGVVSEQQRGTNGISQWVWRFKDVDPHIKTPGDVDDVGDVGDLENAKNAKNANISTPGEEAA